MTVDVTSFDMKGSAGTLPFDRAAPQVLNEVQRACLALLEALPGTVQKAADVHRALGIDPKLGWQIYRVARARTPLAAGTHVPTPIPGKRLAAAAESKGLPSDVITQLRRAFEQFELLVSLHAGDRSSLEAMLTGLNSESGDELDLDKRKAAFAALSHVWGVRVRTRVWCAAFRRGSAPTFLDGISIRGMTDVRRLRQNVEFQLSTFRATDSSGTIVDGDAVEQGLEPGQNLLLSRFCSRPLPRIVYRKMSDGRLQALLAPGEIGKLGAISLYTAEVFRGLDWHKSDPLQRKLGNSILVTKPTEVLVLDMLVERGIFDGLEPSVSVFGDLDQPGEFRSEAYSSAHVLPITARVERLGVGSAAVATPDVPDYPQMLTYVCERLGWDADSFEVFRCRIEYPVLYGLVAMSVPLPENGNW